MVRSDHRWGCLLFLFGDDILLEETRDAACERWRRTRELIEAAHPSDDDVAAVADAMRQFRDALLVQRKCVLCGMDANEGREEAKPNTVRGSLSLSG
jgi:hypothetical protein